MTWAALALTVAYLLGAPDSAEPVVLASAAEVERSGGSEMLLAEVLTWEKYESRWGDALSGRRWDHRAFGVLQVRDRPDLERDTAGSVRAWLYIRARAAKACGEDLALAGLSSGRCDRGTRLAAQRAAEARWALMLARMAGQ